MPMTTLEQDTLLAGFAACKSVITDLEPRLKALQQQYDATGGVKDTLTQEDLDEATSLSGLSKTEVDDGMYVLTAVLLPGITAGYASLSAMASRYRGMAMPPPSIPL